jgi:phosphate:Na+ symporter
MTATFTILELMGHVVLLLWGMRMVQSGVQRAFGSDLQRVLGRALRNRFVAVLAGAGITLVLQSSTATAMMASSLAARGAVALIPGLAVMLGANFGTALIVKVLSFDVAKIVPVLLIAGSYAFRRFKKGRTHDLGRVGVGLGLMLLALHLIVTTIAPVTTAPVLGQLLSALTGEPVLDLLLAAALTFAAHSSVASMLLLISLAAGNVVTPWASVVLVLGANLGGALPPVFETDATNPAARRLPVGNLVFRAIGCLVALPFALPIAEWLWINFPDDPAGALTAFHLAFNAALAIVFVGVLNPAAALLERMFPDAKKPADPAATLFLDELSFEAPYLALSNAAREILRMGDIVEVMLEKLGAAMLRGDHTGLDEIGRLAKGAEKMREAITAYLARLDAADLAEGDRALVAERMEFTVNLGQAAAVLERGLAQTAHRLAAADPPLGADDRATLERFHGRVVADLRLAMAAMMTQDQRSARELLDAKRDLNAGERTALREHLSRLSPGAAGATPAAHGRSTGTLFLAALSDLRRVNSHLASIGYRVLEEPVRDDDPVADPA